jgi:hypothetical protein
VNRERSTRVCRGARRRAQRALQSRPMKKLVLLIVVVALATIAAKKVRSV